MVSNRRGQRAPPVAPARRQSSRHRGRGNARFTRSPSSQRPSAAFSIAATGASTAVHSGVDGDIPDEQAYKAGAPDGYSGPTTDVGLDATAAAATEPDGVYMALEMKPNGTVGCAYFVAATATLYLHDDTRIVGLELVESLLFQVRPSSIIVPSRAPGAFIDFLDRFSSGVSEKDCILETEGCGFVVRSVVSSDFNPDHGRQLLARLDRAHADYQEGTVFFTTAVEDMEEYERSGDLASESTAGSGARNKVMHLGTLINLDGQASVSSFPHMSSIPGEGLPGEILMLACPLAILAGLCRRVDPRP